METISVLAFKTPSGTEEGHTLNTIALFDIREKLCKPLTPKRKDILKHPLTKHWPQIQTCAKSRARTIEIRRSAYHLVAKKKTPAPIQPKHVAGLGLF